MSARPKLVIGLGNPGREYVGTRHNIGFEVVDRLAARLECSLRSRPKFAAKVGDAGSVTLVKPQTFMNRSGGAVAGLVNWLKLTAVDVLIIVDDADLPLGQLRLRANGGSGGHNGLRSIIEALGGNEEFARLRVGIGRREPVGADITNHVLGKFAADEREAAQQAVEDAVAAVECCLKEGLTAAMNHFNRRKGDAS